MKLVSKPVVGAVAGPFMPPELVETFRRHEEQMIRIAAVCRLSVCEAERRFLSYAKQVPWTLDQCYHLLLGGDEDIWKAMQQEGGEE